jgi:hypothetical protein
MGVAGTDELGVGRGIIGLVGECEGVPSCSSSTSIKFGAPFDRTGAKATGATLTGATAAVAAGMVVGVGAVGDVGLGGFFIPKSLRSRSTAW